MTKFKRQSVKVATLERGEKVLDQSVDALVLGALAVHKPLQRTGAVTGDGTTNQPDTSKASSHNSCG